MKTDTEVELEERARAELEVQRLGARGGGFTPLAGMNRRKLEIEREGMGMKMFSAIMGVLLVVVVVAAWLGPVLGASVIWLGVVILIVALLTGIFVRLGKRG